MRKILCMTVVAMGMCGVTEGMQKSFFQNSTIDLANKSTGVRVLETDSAIAGKTSVFVPLVNMTALLI